MMMRARLGIALLLSASVCSVARAQDAEPPPRIGPFVVDLHATVPKFPSSIQLALSRGLTLAELPGAGLGGDLGVHLYPLKWRALTFGIGGALTVARARATPPAVRGQSTTARAVTERFTSIAPQLSFNFGSGTGWSYLSGGIASSTWSVMPDGGVARVADTEKRKTINYGGGARWFAKKHLAFSFDVRFYAINPGTVEDGFPQSPRTTFMIIGAGVSVK